MVLYVVFQAGQNVFSHGLRVRLLLLRQVRDDTITVASRLVLTDFPLANAAGDGDFYAHHLLGR